MSDDRTVQERLREIVRDGDRHGVCAQIPTNVALRPIMESAADRIDALEKALNPSAWTKEMSAAWHQNIPDTQRAFYALYRAALHPSENEDRK